MKGEILFLSHRIPFPADRGDKIRSHHILKRLAEIGPVHVGTFADDDADLVEEDQLAALTRSHCLVRRSMPVPIAGIRSLLQGEPVSLAAFHHADLLAFVERTLATRPIKTIYVFSGQMGQYVPDDFAGRVILDLVDVDSAKFAAYAQSGNALMRWINAREARLLAIEEQRFALRSDQTLLISAEEAALFVSRLPPPLKSAISVTVLGNGIDSAQFDPVSTVPEPTLATIPEGRLIFTGQMDYRPNIDAVVRMAHRILPKVRNQFDLASLHIVGRSPTDEVLALRDIPGCHVWGRVDDMRCWLAAADVAVAPLEIARGVQNKVLEAMAMGLPVVLTSGAATGIPARSGQEFLIADSDAEIAMQIVGLLKNPLRRKTLGQAGRSFVITRQSWGAALAPLDWIIDPTFSPLARDVA